MVRIEKSNKYKCKYIDSFTLTYPLKGVFFCKILINIHSKQELPEEGISL